MPPKARPWKLSEAISSQHVDNVDTRSGFGDNRTATDDALMAVHTQVMRTAGVISEEMEHRLSQARHQGSNLEPIYTKEYLAMHPEYTGSNVDEMPSYQVALRRQREKDRAVEKWLADYRAGNIDANGNTIRRNEQYVSSIPSMERGSQSILNNEEQTGHTTVSVKDSDDRYMYNIATSAQTRKAPTTDLQTPHPKSHTVQNDTTTPIGRPVELPIIPNILLNRPLSISTPSSKPSSPVTPPLTIHPNNPTAPAQSRPRRPPRPIVTVIPRTQLPGHPTYVQYNYFALAALCRERSLSSGGNTEMLRNRLIQDDTNMALGKPRENKVHKGGTRKTYKNGVPREFDAGGSGGDSKGGSGALSDETLSEVLYGGAKRKSSTEIDGYDSTKKVKLTTEEDM